MKIQIKKEVQKVMDIIESEGYMVHVVGGAIRNQLLGIPVKDWDLTTDATPAEISEIFDKHKIPTLPTGVEHGTMTVCYRGMNIEVTTHRTDGKYSDNRRPDSVKFNVTLEEDLSRRDFTINALAYNRREGLIDLFGGLSDLKSKTIRCVGNAQDRFSEDALRMLRAIRFANTLDFNIDLDIKIAIKNLKSKMKNISDERIEQEISKILTTGHGIKYFSLLQEMVPWLFKEDAKKRIDMCNYFLNYIKDNDLVTNLTSMFLYDILDLDFLERLKYSNRIKKEVNSLIECCQEIEQNDTLFLQSYGVINYNIKKCLLDRFDRVTVFKAMYICQNRIGIMLKKMENLTNITYDIISKEEPVSFSELDINGDDIRNFNIEGKEIGKWLKFLQDYVWKYPKANKKNFLKEMIRKRKK